MDHQDKEKPLQSTEQKIPGVRLSHKDGKIVAKVVDQPKRPRNLTKDKLLTLLNKASENYVGPPLGTPTKRRYSSTFSAKEDHIDFYLEDLMDGKADFTIKDQHGNDIFYLDRDPQQKTNKKIMDRFMHNIRISSEKDDDK